MAIEGYYYLHTNGELIYKRYTEDVVADLRESDFVVAFWPIDVENRKTAWDFLVEAKAAGANRIGIHAERWKCDDEDAQNYAKAINLTLQKDGSDWMAAKEDFMNIQESPTGWGKTCLEAMVSLCIQLGYKPSKMWGHTFESLVRS